MEGFQKEDDDLIEIRKWEDLNTDCLVKVLQKVGLDALVLDVPFVYCLVKVLQKVGLDALVLDVPFVCKSWHKASLDPQLWKIIDFESIKIKILLRRPRVSLYVVTKLAIKRSRGIATEVVLPSCYLHRDLKDILRSIADGCPMLKSLILSDWSAPSILGGLIAEWKDLECLNITKTYTNHFKELLTQINTNCKNFTALTTTGTIRTEDALLIVTLLSNVRRLTLSGCQLSRESLILISSKCRELVLLEVSNCIGFCSDDEEILKMATHIENFMSKGSKSACSSYSDYYYLDSSDDEIDFR